MRCSDAAGIAARITLLPCEEGRWRARDRGYAVPARGGKLHSYAADAARPRLIPAEAEDAAAVSRPNARIVSSTFVYVACTASNEIAAFTLDSETGCLEALQRIAVPPGLTPLALSPNRHFLYAGLRGEQPAVLSCAIDPLSGRLKTLANSPLPHPPMYLGTDAGGAHLLSASYAGSAFSINPIGSDGIVAAPPVQVTATPPQAHGILTDRTNRYLFVTSLGGDAVLQYAFDPSTGRAVPNEVPFISAPPGSGPRHLVLHPNRDLVYVNGELDGSIQSYAFDPGNGRLRELARERMLPEASDLVPWAAELAIEPGGRYLYASERRGSTLTVFELYGEAGALRRQESIDTEEQPRSFAIDPRGAWLVLAGEKSHHAIVYAIDPSTGCLAARGRYWVGLKPTWVTIAELP